MLPSSDACTVPGLISIKSPFFTGFISNISSKSFFLAFSTNFSLVIPSFIPRISLASSLASITYHDSLFPSSFSCFIAYSSLGCTCIESLSFTSRYLIKSGNKFLYSLYTLSPTSSPLYSSNTSCSVFPANSPFSTILIPCECALISHDSPIFLPAGISIPNTFSNASPPHILSINTFLNLNGYNNSLTPVYIRPL